MMRVACLILGYSAPDILRHALPTLRGAGFDIYLHLDSKIERTAYCRKLSAAGQDVQVLEQRLNIFWGGYRMMQAGLILLQAAHETGPYDRYLLISDDSFPVLPAKVLQAYMAEQDDCITMVRQPGGNIYHQRYYNFFFYDHPAVAARGERHQEIDQAFEHTIEEIAVLRRIGKKPIDVYFGSQFWALTQATAAYLLDVVRNDLHLVKSFQYAASRRVDGAIHHRQQAWQKSLYRASVRGFSQRRGPDGVFQPPANSASRQQLYLHPQDRSGCHDFCQADGGTIG